MIFPFRWPAGQMTVLVVAVYRYCTSTGFYSSRGNQIQICLYIEQETLSRKKRRGCVDLQVKATYIRNGWKYQDKTRTCLSVAVKKAKVKMNDNCN